MWAVIFLLPCAVLSQILPEITQEVKPHHRNLRSRSLSHVSTSAGGRRRLWTVQPYNQTKMMTTMPEFDVFPTRVLIYNGADDTFTIYNADHEEVRYPSHTRNCGRCGEVLRLLVDSLHQNYPDRFSLGKPPLQLLFRVADAPRSHCMNNPELCDMENFAPILSFGSVVRDPSFFPTELVYPHKIYSNCLYGWKFNGKKMCNFGLDGIDKESDFNDLIPQIIWRGSDFDMLPFMEEFNSLGGPTEDIWPKNQPTDSETKESLVDEVLSQYSRYTPRWKAVALTLRAEMETAKQGGDALPWINCKFFGDERDSHQHYASAGIPVAAHQRMGPQEMSKYKYHIDIGGGGGTTWGGTISKLGMPGVLFHYESPTMDWFYNDMIPYVHYIPIMWDLSDLKEKFDWAEAHPEEAEKISKAATALYHRITSLDYMENLYDNLFVQQLGNVVNSYEPDKEETFESIVARYKENRFNLHEVASCTRESCSIEVDNEGRRVTL